MVIFFFPVFDVIICNVLYDTLYIELLYTLKKRKLFTRKEKNKRCGEEDVQKNTKRKTNRAE